MTAVLLVPDLFILYKGQPLRGVAVLMCMHVAIALVTYNGSVRVAPVGPDLPRRGDPDDVNPRHQGKSIT